MQLMVVNNVELKRMVLLVVILLEVNASPAGPARKLGGEGQVNEVTHKVLWRDLAEQDRNEASGEIEEVNTEMYTSGKRMVLFRRNSDNSIRQCQIYGDSEQMKASLLNTVSNLDLKEYEEKSLEFRAVLKECQAFQVEMLPELTSRIKSAKSRSKTALRKTGMSSAETEASSFNIYPGTNWCGTGNVADDNELGILAGVDSCCRKHDNCPRYIAAGDIDPESRLKNDGYWIKCHCDCDESFKKCLLEQDSIHADIIGATFFDILNMECFAENYPWECLGSWLGICLEYGYNHRSYIDWRFYNHLDYPWWN